MDEDEEEEKGDFDMSGLQNMQNYDMGGGGDGGMVRPPPILTQCRIKHRTAAHPLLTLPHSVSKEVALAEQLINRSQALFLYCRAQEGMMGGMGGGGMGGGGPGGGGMPDMVSRSHSGAIDCITCPGVWLLAGYESGEVFRPASVNDQPTFSLREQQQLQQLSQSAQ